MSNMSKRTTRKIGNVRVTRTESNGRVKTSQSSTFKGSNGFRATHRISKNSKGQDVHHYSTALGNGWVRRETRGPNSGMPKSRKTKSNSSAKRTRRNSSAQQLNPASILVIGGIAFLLWIASLVENLIISIKQIF